MTDKKIVAQGDVFAFEIAAIPSNAKLLTTDPNQPVIVAHSETGHHHLFAGNQGVQMYGSENPNIFFLKLLEGDATLEHMRSFDTHAPIRFDGGKCYEIHRHQEMSPEGWRRVAD